MKCPHCKKKVEEVNVYSEAKQKASVDSEGHTIYYGDIDFVGETYDIECANCGESIYDLITED